MRFVLLAALALVGCLPGEQRCASDADCGAVGVCEPQGFCSFADPSCMTGRRFGDLSGSYSKTCVGEMPDGGTGDRDGDGIADGTDNCPATPNANQFNEDGDKFGDVCDPCPPVANDAPPDGDGDGVADACDPDPAVSGHSIALFEGFHAGVPMGWEVTGTWTMVGDDIEAASAMNIVQLGTQLTTTTHETVSTSLTVMTNSGGNNFAGVIDNRMPGGTSAVSCSLYRTTQFTPTPGLLLSDGTGGGSTAVAYAQAMTAGTKYALSMRRDATMYTCNGETGGNQAMAMGTLTVTNNPSAVGIYVAGTTVRFQWLMVVSNP